MNEKAKLEATRHSTLNATLTYVETSDKKEVEKLHALIIAPPFGPGTLNYTTGRLGIAPAVGPGIPKYTTGRSTCNRVASNQPELQK